MAKMVLISAMVLSQEDRPANGQYPASHTLELREPGEKYSTFIQSPVRLDDMHLMNQVDIEFQGVQLMSGTKNGRGWAMLKAKSFNVLPVKK